MKHNYQAYTKKVNGTEHFFVKKFLSFPEYQHVPDVMEGFGMHTNFSKACQIAGITDPQVMNNIFKDMSEPASHAIIIEMGNNENELRANAG